LEGSVRVLNDNNQWVGDGQVIDAEPRVWDRRYGSHPSEKEWREIQRMQEEFLESVVVELQMRKNQMVRAKFTLQSITNHSWSPSAQTFKFSAVYDQTTEENRRYSKATPNGSLEMTVDNPPAQEFFELGKTYYLDFSKAE
jgi:hypothetical protein